MLCDHRYLLGSKLHSALTFAQCRPGDTHTPHRFSLYTRVWQGIDAERARRLKTEVRLESGRVTQRTVVRVILPHLLALHSSEGVVAGIPATQRSVGEVEGGGAGAGCGLEATLG